MNLIKRLYYSTTLTVLVIFGLSTIFLFGCKSKNTYEAPPPPTVTVSKPIVKDITDFVDFTGYTQSNQKVNIKARVAGILESMNFSPGQKINKGDLLFVIEPTEYEDNLKMAKGHLESAQAQLVLAEAKLKRLKEASKSNAVSELDVIQATADCDAAKANVTSTEAELGLANQQLQYTNITAPIGGIISENYIDVGNLVGTGQSINLAYIVNDDPMFIYFDMDDEIIMNLLQQGSGEVFETDFLVGLGEGIDFPYNGKLSYIAPDMDLGTGTVTVRGKISNKKGEILSGAFVRVRVPAEEIKDAVLIPESALAYNQSGPFLLIVSKKDSVFSRNVDLGCRYKNLRAVKEGLKPDEQIIISGLQLVRPGMKVSPIKGKITIR